MYASNFQQLFAILGGLIFSIAAIAAEPVNSPGHTYPLANRELIYYVTHGSGKPVVFMHGIPSSSYLWRNVLPAVGENAEAIAFDLPGYGKSSAPSDGDYSYNGLYKRTEKFLEHYDAPITLVVNDLGSLLGLDYATRHPERVSGIVLVEAAFMPAQQWYQQLLTKQKMMFWLFRNATIADWMIVDQPRVQRMALEMGTKRTLSNDDLAAYLHPYADLEKRKVLRYGPGPANVPKGMVSRHKDDMAAVMDRVAAKLIAIQLPTLLLYAEPGFIVQQEALEYAQANFKHITVKNIGAGLHFLPEDQPAAIAREINDWLKTH